MNTKIFVPRELKTDGIDEEVVKWRSPSNIALVKYWGKVGYQIPANPSISFTLKNSYTETEIKFVKKETANNFIDFKLLFEGKKNESFSSRVAKFLEDIKVYVPFLKLYSLEISTINSFPHSSGIASSASGFSALSACLVAFEKLINPELMNITAQKKVSFLSRLGSGSACRSVEGPLMIWGRHQNYRLSDNEVAVTPDLVLNDVFKGFQDTILLVDKGAKSVSSTVGHSLMDGHPFAKRRFEQANEHLAEMKEILQNGDLNRFAEIVENDALTLHAMMMTSTPSFILMKPNTLLVLEAIKEHREKSGLNMVFTLDAGANVHLLYPLSQKDKVMEFVKNDLVAYCENGHYICDELGTGIEEVN
ncbi:MAG: diphosphomevalonate decarboxylase [Flavobacteriales bacterium]|nr:diphosphomevalonate decarboxylase [Flavobacteriales bacterium]